MCQRQINSQTENIFYNYINILYLLKRIVVCKNEYCNTLIKVKKLFN